MHKHIHFFSVPGTRYFALDCFKTILVYFIDEYEGDSRMKDEIDLARSLVSFLESDNLDYYNA